MHGYVTLWCVQVMFIPPWLSYQPNNISLKETALMAGVIT